MTLRLSRALAQTHADGGRFYDNRYELHVDTHNNLKKLGVDLVAADIAQCTGDYIQQYMHAHLMYSLYKIGTVPQAHEPITRVLHYAVALNSIGRDHNKKHNIAQAVFAKMACDAVTDYARTVAKYVLVAGEGLCEGAINGIKDNFLALGVVGKAALDAATYPEETLDKIHDAFNTAVVAVARLAIEYRLLRKHDDVALKKLEAYISTLACQGCDAFAQWNRETPRHQKVKSIFRFFSECYTSSKLSGLLLQAVAKPIAIEATLLGNIFKNPEAALAREIVDITLNSIGKDPQLIKEVITCAQKDVEFFQKSKAIGTSVGKEVSKLLSESLSAPTIFEKNAKHIFRNASGHLADTYENRKLLISITSDAKNLLGIDKYGNEWFAKTLPDGKQVWSSVRSNLIRNGGLNDSPRVFNNITGLSSL
ncbi:MAG: hypothetical protein WC707_03225 [Candidatus Babeliaceae bacterium]